MDVKEAIIIRRATRSFEPIDISDEIIKDLASSAQLAPSCMNNQPWRYVFIRNGGIQGILPALSKGNKVWAKHASLIIAVFSESESDCVIKERQYYLFDTGLATSFIILRATELGLVAHPIAGYDENKAKEILEIPDKMRLITFVIVGKQSSDINPGLSEGQKKQETSRPPRKPLKEFIYLEKYGNMLNA